MPDRKKVLIIDDEKDLGLLLKDFLTRKCCDVTLSHSLGEGKALLQSLHPDILFLDNNLPDEEGWESAPDIATQFPHMYIYLISAYHPDVPPMPPGARFSVIEKPLSFADLEME